MTRETRSTQRRSPNLSLVVIGMGLVLIGLAAFYFLPRVQDNISTVQNLESSVIPAQVNYPAPQLSLTDVQGKASSLADYRGQVVLVNLWATWCPPCKAEMPTLQAFYEKYKQDGFLVVAINDGDPASDVIQFVGNYNLTFPVWLDPKYTATEKAFQTPNLPSSYLMDRSGAIRLRWVGETSQAMLEKYVAPIITE